MISPYLNFKGTTEEAFNLYKSVFGGEFVIFMRYKDSPDGNDVPEAEKNNIMHVSLTIGNNQVLMGTDMLESMKQDITIGNNISLSVKAQSEEETDKIYKALAEGGKASMPPQKTFWGAYWGMLTDKFGIIWMVSYDYPKE